MSSLPQVMKEPGGRTLDDDDDDDDKVVYEDQMMMMNKNENSLLSCRLPGRPGRLRVPRCKRSGRGKSETCQPDILDVNDDDPTNEQVDSCPGIEVQRYRPF